MSGLRVERLASPRALASLAGDCQRLAASMQPRVPFATNAWLELWWRHYREQRTLVSDQFYVHAVRNGRGEVVAVVPLMLTERPATGPLRVRSVTFFGSDKNVTELRGLICAPEDEAAVTRAVLSHFAERNESWDWFSWHGVRRGSDAYAILSGTENFSWRRETTDYVLQLPSTWEEFRASRSRNIKESLRKCYNSLRRAGHRFEFRVAAESAELSAAMERFFRLHKRRAEAPHLVRHEDVFATPRARRLLLDLAARTDDSTQLRVFELSVGGTVVASRLGFLLGDELYLYFSGYEPAWGTFSVMTTTVAEAIRWAIEHRFRVVNLSPGTDVSKTRWGASATTTCEGVLLAPTRRGRVAFDLVNGLHERSGPGTLLGRVVNVARRGG